MPQTVLTTRIWDILKHRALFQSSYAKEKKLLTLPEAIRKITYDPATRFGITGKGEIREGFDADIVIFDPCEIKDNADYVGHGDPNKPPSGIDYVIVNGRIVLRDGQLTENVNAGRMLVSR